MTAEKPLSAKKQRFVEEYVLDWNATQAARRAGYSHGTAGSVGARLLKDVQIAHLVKEKRTEITQRAHQAVEDMVLTPARTLREIARIAYFDPRKLYNEHGGLKKVTELDDDTAAALSAMDVEEIAIDGAAIGVTKKVKFWDKGKALDQSMKHFGLYELDNAQGVSAAVVMFAEMRTLVAGDPLSRKQPVLLPPEEHIHQ